MQELSFCYTRADMQHRNKHTHQPTLMQRLHTETLTSVCVCWFRGSDRVRGISLITWDAEAKRYGQHVKDGRLLSWSSPSGIMLLFLNFFPVTECWCGINAQISHSHHVQWRTEKNPGTGSAEFLKNPSQTKLQRSFQLSEPSFRLQFCCVLGHFSWVLFSNVATTAY